MLALHRWIVVMRSLHIHGHFLLALTSGSVGVLLLRSLSFERPARGGETAPS